MNLLTLALQGAAKVLVAGLVLGAGLPVLFAVGVWALSYGDPRAPAESESGSAPHTAPLPARALGYLCFAVVLLAIAFGMAFTIASNLGKGLSFEHVFPTFVNKH